MRLHSTSDLNDVKRLNLSRMGHRYIEIMDSTEVEFMQAQHSYMPQDNDQMLMNNPHLEEIVANENGVLRCRGLPYGAGEPEIADFFKCYQMVPEGVKIVIQKDGRPSGQAFVLFES